MFLEKIITILISLKNLFSINLLIIFYKIKGYKILLFYHPKKNFKNISNYYVEKLLAFPKNKKIKTIILDNSTKNFFKNNYIKQYFIKYIQGVDFFLNNYVCDVFPNNCLRVYLHHDIYDTPLVNYNKERELFKRFNNYDFILIPSEKSKKIFLKLKKNYKNEEIKLIIIGYYKLDYLKKKISLKKRKFTNNIVIAPTDYYTFPKMSLIPKIESIIDKILRKTNYNIVFRPHPSNLNYKNVNKIIKKFIKNKRVKIDKTTNYLKTYFESELMISDLSGTAYTYSFLTHKPTIFFSNYEHKLKILNYSDLNFFNDRNKIGYIVNSNTKLTKILNNKNNHKKKTKLIKKILSSSIKIGEAKSLFDNFVYKVL